MKKLGKIIRWPFRHIIGNHKKYVKLRTTHPNVAESAALGIEAFFLSLLSFGALGAGLWAIPWLQANVASAFLSQLAVIGCYLAMIDFAFNGVIGSLQRCILQLRLNKMPIGAAALFIWILCLVVLVVCILTNMLVLPF